MLPMTPDGTESIGQWLEAETQSAIERRDLVGTTVFGMVAQVWDLIGPENASRVVDNVMGGPSQVTAGTVFWATLEVFPAERVLAKLGGLLASAGRHGANLAEALWRAAAGRADELASGLRELAERYCRGGVCPCFAAGTPVLTVEGLVPIEELEVGDRVLPDDPACVDTTEGEWFRVALTMPDPEHTDDFTIEVLRPAEWLEQLSVREGTAIWLDLDEMNVGGRAVVDVVTRYHDAWPSAVGCVVTGTIRHIAARTSEVHFEGNPEPLRTTPEHRIYSVDRRSWVAAGELGVGEQVDSLAASGARVAGVRTAHRASEVYNLEVAGSFRYRVSHDAILVHNQYEGLSDEVAEQLSRELYAASGRSVSGAVPALNRLGLSQEQAIDMLKRMYAVAGKGTGGVQAMGDGSRVLMSRRVGAHQAVMVIGADGQVRAATATLEMTYDLANPMRATNIEF